MYSFLLICFISLANYQYLFNNSLMHGVVQLPPSNFKSNSFKQYLPKCCLIPKFPLPQKHFIINFRPFYDNQHDPTTNFLIVLSHKQQQIIKNYLTKKCSCQNCSTIPNQNLLLCPINKIIKKTTIQVSYKNAHVNLLQTQDIPKDDRLILRKYLGTLKQLNYHNQIINLLLKYTSKSNKQNTSDQKIQVLLRKHADRIKKQYLQEITSFQKTTPVQPTLHNHSNKSNNIDQIKFQNYQALKQIIKTPIPTSTTSKKSQSLTNSKVNSIPSTLHQAKGNPMNGISHNKVKKLSNNFQFPLLKCSPRSSEFISMRKNLGSFKNPSLSTQKLKQLYPKTPHINTFTPLQSKSPPKKRCAKIPKSKSPQPTKNSNTLLNIIFPHNKHKHTLSKSMIKLSAIDDQEKSPQKSCLTIREVSKDVSSYRSQEITSKITDLSMIEKSVENSNTSSIYNFSTFNCQRQTNFELCHEYLVAKSVHSQLKNLKIPSEQLFDFIIPHTLRSSRTPLDLSLPYSDFISKLNQFIKYNYTSIPDHFCSAQTVYIPFHTQYDLVTFDKLTKFLQQYTVPQYQNNQVRNLFTKLKIIIYGPSNLSYQRKKINVQDFKILSNYKQSSLLLLFQQLIKKSNQWGTSITYWQLYWIKYTPEYLTFQQQFNTD